MKSFPIGEVIDFVHAEILTKPGRDHLSSLRELFDYMTRRRRCGCNFNETMEAILASLERQLPWLADLNVPAHDREGSAYVWAWLDQIEQRLGETVALQPMTTQEWSGEDCRHEASVTYLKFSDLPSELQEFILKKMQGWG